MKRLYTDIDPFCCEVLRARVADGGLPPGEVWERDIKTITAAELATFRHVHLFCGIGGSPLGLKWAGWPDEWSIVTGGFPCQPVSVAGKGLAQADDRWLWPEMHRVIDIVRPDWVLAENVPGLRTRGVDIVLGDLEGSGYGVWALVVGADDVGAPHRRKRVWVVGLANASRTGLRVAAATGSGDARNAITGAGEAMVNPNQRGRGIDKPGRGQDRGAAAGRTGSSDLADAHRAGQSVRANRRTNSACGSAAAQAEGNACEAWHRDSEDLGNTERDGLRASRRAAAKVADERRDGPVWRWPMPPGPEQHEWEAPRLTQSGVGVATDGLPRRLAGLARRNALKALGNSQVPQVVEVIARAMREAMAQVAEKKPCKPAPRRERFMDDADPGALARGYGA